MLGRVYSVLFFHVATHPVNTLLLNKPSILTLSAYVCVIGMAFCSDCRHILRSVENELLVRRCRTRKYVYRVARCVLRSLHERRRDRQTQGKGPADRGFSGSDILLRKKSNTVLKAGLDVLQRLIFMPCNVSKPVRIAVPSFGQITLIVSSSVLHKRDCKREGLRIEPSRA